MTIATSIRRAIGQGNGATTVWPYAFLIQNAAQLSVVYTNPNKDAIDVNGTGVVLNPAVYSVTGLGNPAGGNVTYPLAGPAVAAPITITILRTLPLTQPTTLTNQGAFYAQAAEGAMDVLDMQIQQIGETQARVLALPVGFDQVGAGVNPTVPIPIPGATLAWDPTGKFLVNALVAAGLVIGPVTAGQIQYGQAANMIGGDANLTWDSVNKKFAALGQIKASSDVNSAAIISAVGAVASWRSRNLADTGYSSAIYDAAQHIFQVGGSENWRIDTLGHLVMTGSAGGAGGTVRYIGPGGAGHFLFNVASGNSHIWMVNEVSVGSINASGFTCPGVGLFGGANGNRSAQLEVLRNSVYNAEAAGIYLMTGTGTAGETALFLFTDKANNVAGVTALQPGTSSRSLVLNPIGGTVTCGVTANPAITAPQTLGVLSVRNSGPGIEFGHANTAGYVSVLGCQGSNGNPFLGFCTTNGTNANTYRTLGIKGISLSTDLNGAFQILSVPSLNADNQAPVTLGSMTSGAGWSWGSGNATFGTVTKRKSADQSVTNSTVLVNDSDLVLALAANEEWVGRAAIFCGTLLNGHGLQVTMTFPSGATFHWNADVRQTTSATTPLGSGDLDFTGAGTATFNAAFFTNSRGMVFFDFWVLNGATPGNVNIQFAQQTANASALTFAKGSYLQATRVA